MGNTISSSADVQNALDLSNGDTKIKQKLSVLGTSTFTGDSTFGGNLSITNGKINNVSVPTLDSDVTTLKSDVSGLKSTVASVSAGSFTNQAITTTDVNASGNGTFNALKTTNIDINGDIISSTGAKYIIGNSTNGLSLTNGQTTTKAQILLNKDGTVEIAPLLGQKVKINDVEFSKTALTLAGATTYINNLTTSGLVTSGGLSTTGTVTAGTIQSNGSLSSTGLITASNGITLPAKSTLTANGGITASSLNVTGTSSLTGAITANGGLTASTLSVSGTTTATGAITANGGITTSTLTSGDSTFTGNLNAKNLTIGSTKWLIDEVSDTKGTRLCFGKVDTTAPNGKKYWTCLRADNGNLELF